jgi:hypothetical protein
MAPPDFCRFMVQTGAKIANQAPKTRGANAFLSVGCDQSYNPENAEDNEDQEENFPSALRIPAGDLAGYAVDEHLE